MAWLASPALPVGGFSYSEGLEAAVEAGAVADEAAASRWLEDSLELQLARSEQPLVSRAAAAWVAREREQVVVLNDWLFASRESAELRAQSEHMGRAMLAWLRNGPERDDPRLHMLATLAPAPGWPIAFALAGVQAGAATRQIAVAFAFGWAENAAQTAIKAVPLGQAAGQRLLQRLVDAIPAAVDAALARTDTTRQAFAPMLAILSARHETQYSTLFRS